MGYDTSIACPTPICVETIAKHGDAYKRVADTTYNKHPTCEGCGGKLIDGQWVHTCQSCGQSVEPGSLGGLFVPHLCPKCLAHKRATDRKCTRCNQPNIDCCC